MSELVDLEHLQQWVGKTQSTADIVTCVPVAAMSATLDRSSQQVEAGYRLPELWHWLYFLPVTRQSEIGDDGHPQRGAFLPPVPLPRRMWAGSQFEFHHPIHVGESIARQSTIENVTHKSGKSGELVFVRVKHQISNSKAQRAITEYHDIVYREAPQANAPPPASRAAPTSADWEKLIHADDVLLFRYSALTFNGHRIHYDRQYVTEVEGYPGLVVHGPLIATLLLDALRAELNDPTIVRYEFKALKPVFDINPFTVCGATENNGDNTAGERTVRLWAKDHLGDLTMEAYATIA